MLPWERLLYFRHVYVSLCSVCGSVCGSLFARKSGIEPASDEKNNFVASFRQASRGLRDTSGAHCLARWGEGEERAFFFFFGLAVLHCADFFFRAVAVFLLWGELL